MMRTPIPAAFAALFALGATALAQDSVDYEFRFEYQEDSAFNPVADDTVQDRLDEESRAYCERLARENRGLYVEECQKQIVDAVNDEMSETEAYGTFAEID